MNLRNPLVAGFAVAALMLSPLSAFAQEAAPAAEAPAATDGAGEAGERSGQPSAHQARSETRVRAQLADPRRSAQGRGGHPVAAGETGGKRVLSRPRQPSWAIMFWQAVSVMLLPEFST